MKSAGNTLLSPTAAAILSPRIGTNSNNANMSSVVVPKNGFNPTSIQTPIANLTPVHIPYLGGAQNGNNAAGQNGNNGNGVWIEVGLKPFFGTTTEDMFALFEFVPIRGDNIAAAVGDNKVLPADFILINETPRGEINVNGFVVTLLFKVLVNKEAVPNDDDMVKPAFYG